VTTDEVTAYLSKIKTGKSGFQLTVYSWWLHIWDDH